MSALSRTHVKRLGDQADSELRRGINNVSIQTDAHGLPFAITLWQSKGVGTKIESLMHDLAERVEVGVLSATRVDELNADEVLVDVSSDFSENLILTKLVIDVELHRLESGLILTGRHGRQIVIVPGAYPYSLAILGLGDAPHRFEPEYPLDLYLRLPVG